VLAALDQLVKVGLQALLVVQVALVLQHLLQTLLAKLEVMDLQELLV
jgi:hypothetical protein